MSLNFIWYISYNWPDAVWAHSFQTALAVSQAMLSDFFFSPPAVLDYYSSYMAGHMYSFCFLITLIFIREKPSKHTPVWWLVLVEDLRIIPNRKKKIHSPKDLQIMNCKGPKNRAGCCTGQSNSSLFLSLSSTLDFQMFSLVQVRSSLGSGK